MGKLRIGDFPLISAGRALRPVITGSKKFPATRCYAARGFNGKVARGLQKRRQVHRDTRDLLANDLL
jgi:hypothetical protein